MSVTKEFMEAVESRKKIRVRIMLKDSLLVDPTAVQFDEMEQYAVGLMDNLYVEHDGENLNFDVSSWDEDYLNEEMVSVVNNFSHDRIDLLKSMVYYLYKDKVNEIHNEEKNIQANSGITRRQIGAGVTVAGAALTVTGLCTSQVILTIGGGAAVVAGVALIASDKRSD